MGKKHTINPSYLNTKGLENVRFLDRGDETLSRYLKDIKNLPGLTQEEELELFSEYRSGGKGSSSAKTKLVMHNQRFVVTLAKRYCPVQTDICDIINEGNYGLLVAMDRYKPNENTRFLTYAGPYILKYIFEYLEKNSLIKQKNRERVYGAVTRYTEKFFTENGRYPNLDELQDMFEQNGVKISDKSDLVDISVIPIGGDTDDSADSDHKIEYGDWDRFDDRMNQTIVNDNLEKVLNILPPLEKQVILKTYGIGTGIEKDVKTISEELDISPYKVNTYFKSGIDKMRKYKRLLE